MTIEDILFEEIFSGFVENEDSPLKKYEDKVKMKSPYFIIDTEIFGKDNLFDIFEKTEKIKENIYAAKDKRPDKTSILQKALRKTDNYIDFIYMKDK